MTIGIGFMHQITLLQFYEKMGKKKKKVFASPLFHFSAFKELLGLGAKSVIIFSP